MAALKLSLQPRPLMMRGRGLWNGRSPLRVTSATAVWRLSRELDFFRPSDGPTSLVDEPEGIQSRDLIPEKLTLDFYLYTTEYLQNLKLKFYF